jgi:hypothetical protein
MRLVQDPVGVGEGSTILLPIKSGLYVMIDQPEPHSVTFLARDTRMVGWDFTQHLPAAKSSFGG